MRSSSGMKRIRPELSSGSLMKREKFCGTLRRANSWRCDFGLRTRTARLSESPEM